MLMACELLMVGQVAPAVGRQPSEGRWPGRGSWVGVGLELALERAGM